MWAWVLKLVSGWIPSSKEKTGKLIWAIGISLLVFILATNVMEHFFPSKPTVVNVAGNYNQEPQDVAHFGCSMWRGYIRLGIKK